MYLELRKKREKMDTAKLEKLLEDYCQIYAKTANYIDVKNFIENSSESEIQKIVYDIADLKIMEYENYEEGFGEEPEQFRQKCVEIEELLTRYS